MKSASCVVPAAEKRWGSKCSLWSCSPLGRVRPPGAQPGVAGDGPWVLLTNDVTPPMLEGDLKGSAPLLCISHTNISDRGDAIHSAFILDPFWTASTGFSICFFSFLQARGCAKGILPIHCFACACHLGFFWFNSKIKDWKIEPNGGINLCGKHTSVIIFILINRLRLHSNTRDFSST